MKGNFIVTFEDPFWVGIIKIEDNNKIRIARWIFGSEPSEAEIYDFLYNDYDKLKFHEVQTDKVNKEYYKSPKRIQKEIRQIKQKGVNLKKSYDIIKKQYESMKTEKKKNKKIKKQEKEVQKFQLKQEKKKQKHRGH
jgi:hypothetical protein